jgi:hypothetical protein
MFSIIKYNRYNLKIFQLIYICFSLNILFFIVHLILYVFLLINPGITFNYFSNPDEILYHNLVVYSFFVPAFVLWFYNIWFFYKYDRYSLSIIPLIFLNFFYSPYYFYKIHIKGRPLRNKGNEAPLIDEKLKLQNYENENDFQEDVKKIENG